MLSALVTECARRYGLRAGLIDIPNERSSHREPTVRGGGLGIVLTFLVFLAGLAYAGSIPANLAWTLIVGGGLVALVGWKDDHRHVAVHWRLLAQFIAAGWAVICVGNSQIFNTDGVGLFYCGIKWLFSVVGIVWLTNLYNFMDGIDGLAASQAVLAGLAGGALLWWAGLHELALVAVVLASTSMGFLLWNWPSARIFMGDVGSGLLGYSFAVLALASEYTDKFPALLWGILLAVFVLDATFTLTRRILRREVWYKAHRCHAYQRLIQKGYSHLQVLIGVILLNIVVLWPLAGFALMHPSYLPGIFFLTALGAWGVWIGVQRACSS